MTQTALTQAQIEEFLKYNEGQLDAEIGAIQNEIDFGATRRRLSKMKQLAIRAKDTERYTNLMSIGAMLDMWEPQS